MRGSRNVCQGGPGLTVSLDNVFFCCCCPQLILACSLQRGSTGFIAEKNYTFPRIQRGLTFSRGSNFFQGGGGGASNANFCRNPYNL